MATLSDSPINSTDVSNESSARLSVCTALLGQVSPALYERNPFRRLGLPVLAGAREAAKRIDELKLAAEFGIAQPDWSFGPEQALLSEQIRAAAQDLKEPTERLIWEIFWFWPESFPAESASDAGLDHLARGETDAALGLWQGAASQGQLAALHNLAVYFHLKALALEAQDTPSEDELVELWFKSLRYWDQVSGEAEFWSCLKARVQGMADARVTEVFVEQLRATWSEALARICAQLALDRARKGLTDRAALHAALVSHIYGDTDEARRALEECAAPVNRRIDARIVEFRNRLARLENPSLEEIRLLLRQSREDLALVAVLCGRTSDFFVEISDGLVDAALDGVVAFQRHTHDDEACLPLLTFLQDFEALPELRSRICETFEAVFRNALSRETSAAAGPAGEQSTGEELKAFLLISRVLVPGVDNPNLNDEERQAYALRVAKLLQPQAVSAGLVRDDLDLSLRIFDGILTLPVRPEDRAIFENDRAQLQRDVEARREKELQVTGENARLIVDRHGICFNDQWLAPSEVTGLRHGFLRPADSVAGSYVIAWRSSSGQEFELNASNLLPASTYVEEHYNRIVASLYFFIVPGLVERLAAEIRAGHGRSLGETALRPEGMMVPAPAVLFWLKDEPVPYSRLQTGIEDGRLIVSSRDHPRQTETHDVALEWNAAVFGYVVEALVRE